MKKTMLIVAVMTLTCIMAVCRAEECFDLREDTTAYCRKVAELSAELPVTHPDTEIRACFDDQRYLVLFRTTNTELEFQKGSFETYSVVFGPNGFSALVCDRPDRAVKWLLAQKGVSAAEADSLVESCSNDGGEAEMTNMDETVFHSWGAAALGLGQYLSFADRWSSDSATVAIVDSGVAPHSLLNPRILSGGYDYIDRDNDPTNDLNGHGTRVAGIVADCTQSLPVYIYPIRVLDAYASGKTSNVINAVIEATQAHVDIINLSLSTFSESEMLEEAIRNAVSEGVTVVAAAGNYSCDAGEVTPAKMRDVGVIVVGSASQDGSRSSFSNYGVSVDIYVYGENISCCSRTGGFVTESGTSMAAPHISALSAMIRLVHPAISPAGIEQRIRTASAGVVNIPAASAMIPQCMGFRLSSVVLVPDTELQLPNCAWPASALEGINYTIQEAGILEIEDSRLVALAEGNTRVTARCTGLEDVMFDISVTDGPMGVIRLPAALEQIDDGAFEGLTTGEVVIPEGVGQIGDGAFDAGQIMMISIPDSVDEIGENDFSGAVILCHQNSAVFEYALVNGLQYISIP